VGCGKIPPEVFGFPGPTAVELDNAITKMIQDPQRQVDGKVPKWSELPRPYGRGFSAMTLPENFSWFSDLTCIAALVRNVEAKSPQAWIPAVPAVSKALFKATRDE